MEGQVCEHPPKLLDYMYFLFGRFFLYMGEGFFAGAGGVLELDFAILIKHL